MRSLRPLLAVAALIGASILIPASPAAALGNGLALTPPMGWNDWNTFGCNVSAQLVEQTADTIVAAGLQSAGYQYVNIDDCWMSTSRSPSGHLVPDPNKFPGGITEVANYVHGKGLKLGIYESAGTATCAGYPGSLNHESTDASDFAAWGVDYLKYDNCNNQGVDWKVRYNAMRDALAATGRPIVYSLCEWGEDNVWTWGAATGNLWRTTGDIQNNYGSMLNIYHQNVGLYPYASKGAWNDPDMLEIGNGMSYMEDRTEFTLWSEMAAPLLIGADLRGATPQTLGVYRNGNVIGVDQDSKGVQGRQISSSGGLDVLAKPLANGDVAVTLFNENASAAVISTSASAAGASAASQYKLTNLWSNVVTTTSGTISASVPGHGVVAYRVTPGGSGTSVGVAKQLVSAVANRCLDVYDNETTDGTRTEIWDCNPGANQKWTPTSAGELRTYGTSTCLDANGSTSGSKVTIWTCNGGTNQQWHLNPDGTITGVQSGLCLDVTGGNNDAGRANGALAELFTCNGGSNQDWQLR